MSQFEPYLFFDGNCADAMRFYERTLGGKLEALMTYGEGPGCDQMAPEERDRIMHARLVLDGHALMASDWTGPQPYEGMKGISVTLSYPTAEEAKRVFDDLAEGGQVAMPLEKTFWAQTFGVVIDRFGLSWMIGGGTPSA